MRASYNGTGIHLSLDKKDKENGLKYHRLEAIIDEYKKPRVILIITDEVKNTRGIEEQGFHIHAWPPHAGLEQKAKYYIHLSKRHFSDLITNPDWKGNFFISRSLYDRISMSYWEATI